MSGTSKEPRGLGLDLSKHSEVHYEHQGGERGGEQRKESKKDISIDPGSCRPHHLTYESRPQTDEPNQSTDELKSARQGKKKGEDVHEKCGAPFAPKPMSEEGRKSSSHFNHPSISVVMASSTSEQQNSPPHTAYLSYQQPKNPGKCEGSTRTFATKCRAVNEVELKPSYSHYPTSDTRTEEAEVDSAPNLLIGPGSSRGVPLGRGRIRGAGSHDRLKVRNRVNGWEPEVMPPFVFPSSTQGRIKAMYPGSSPKTSRLAELAVPISQVREGEEEYHSSSYSSTRAYTTIQRNTEDSLTAAIASIASNSSKTRNTLSSISRVEENPYTPSVPRARKESVSDSSTASTHFFSTFRVPQNQRSPDSRRSPSPCIILDDNCEPDDRRDQPWSRVGVTIHPRDTYRDDLGAPTRVKALDRVKSSNADNPILRNRSHVSRSPDGSYFLNASAGSKAPFQGTVTYQTECRQDPVNESRHQYSEPHSSYSSEHPSKIQSLLPPTYTRAPFENDDGIVAEESYSPTRSGSGGKDDIERRILTRSKQNIIERDRSYGSPSTLSTLESGDARKQQQTYAEYYKTGHPQNGHNSIMIDIAHDSSVDRIGISKSSVRFQHVGSSDLNTNPPSKATSSYSTPSTASTSLSPILSKSLPSLRETFASLTTSAERLPLPRSVNSTSLGHPPQTVTILPVQTTSSRLVPGAPWLYDGEEPELEEDEGFAVMDEEGPPKKKRRTRVALSCAECKRRKIKCDRAQPCTPCARRGDQSNCKWAVMETKDGTPTRAEFEALKNRVAKLERLLFPQCLS